MLSRALQQYVEEQFASAEKILRALLVLVPGDARPLKLLAAVRQVQKRYGDAATLFENALARDPDDPYVLVALGEIKLHTYRVAEAAQLFRRLLELERYRHHPATQRARYLVARFLEQQSTVK